MYKQALRGAANTSTWYGYAVALDRDGRTTAALEAIRALGPHSRSEYHRSVIRGETFYVPDGEKYYYFALIEEAFGADESAVEQWKLFIKSGAHPEYQPRAKAHLDALLGRKNRSPVPFETPWRGILR
jgi:hypothetical protein